MQTSTRNFEDTYNTSVTSAMLVSALRLGLQSIIINIILCIRIFIILPYRCLHAAMPD